MAGQFTLKNKKAKSYKPSQKNERRRFTPAYEEACRIRSTPRWKECSASIKREWRGMCCYCFNAPSEHTHHIKPLAKFPKLAYEHDNLAPLCEKHHMWMEARNKRGEDTESQIRERMQENREKYLND